MKDGNHPRVFLHVTAVVDLQGPFVQTDSESMVPALDDINRRAEQKVRELRAPKTRLPNGCAESIRG